jgi:hypothetical protein
MTEKTNWTEAGLRAAHKASSLPVAQIRRSTRVGCFYCLATFPSTEVVDNHDYAWCPRCGIDSVLPENEVPEVRNPAFLRAMHAFWF